MSVQSFQFRARLAVSLRAGLTQLAACSGEPGGRPHRSTRRGGRSRLRPRARPGRRLQLAAARRRRARPGAPALQLLAAGLQRPRGLRLRWAAARRQVGSREPSRALEPVAELRARAMSLVAGQVALQLRAAERPRRAQAACVLLHTLHALAMSSGGDD